jgi:hypothetical protein
MALETGENPEQKRSDAAAHSTGVVSGTQRRVGPSAWLKGFFGRDGQIRSVIAISIALVSAFGALAAWRATLTSDVAAGNDSTYIQQVTQSGQEKAKLEALVDQDVRLFALYRGHVEAARRLSDEADRLRSSDPKLASSLDAEAQGELAVANTLRGYFQAATIGPSDTSYDRQYFLDYALNHDSELLSLHPAAYLKMGQTLHVRAVLLVGLVAVFVSALFFLTLAQLTRAQLRPLFASVGVAVTVGALIVWPLVENGSFDKVFGQ